jgi:hypothetical protein
MKLSIENLTVNRSDELPPAITAKHYPTQIKATEHISHFFQCNHCFARKVSRWGEICEPCKTRDLSHWKRRKKGIGRFASAVLAVGVIGAFLKRLF